MSTSSSECECEDYWQYNTKYNTSPRAAFGKNPFLSTMGHPLVYYAEVAQPRKHRARERLRGSPNCFVKAFRWYTKELVPNVAPTKPDMTGFAAWLDTKYDEFLQDSNMDSETYHLKIKQTSVIEAKRTSKNSYCDPCERKRFNGRSPWTMKRRTKSNEPCDIKQRSNQSFHYIMQPKDLSCPTSENQNPSNTTLLETECAKKCLAKSHSASNVTLIIVSKHPLNTTSPATPVQEDIKIKECVFQNNTSKSFDKKKSINDKKELLAKKSTAKEDFSCQYSEEKAPKVNAATQYDALDSRGCVPLYQSENIVLCTCPSFNNDRRSVNSVTFNANPNKLNSTECYCKPLDMGPIPRDPQRIKASRDSGDFYCQCPEKKVLKVDTQTQYEESSLERTVHNPLCECDFKEFTQNDPPPLQSTSKISNQCTCDRKVKEKLLTEKLTVKFSQNTAQTSNHSISLENKTIQQYPLFMKIACADKL